MPNIMNIIDEAIAPVIGKSQSQISGEEWDEACREWDKSVREWDKSVLAWLAANKAFEEATIKRRAFIYGK